MSKQNSIVILGRQPELGLVELESLFGADNVVCWGKGAALVRGDIQIDRLSGALKVAEVITETAVGPLREVVFADQVIETLTARHQQGKLTFGVSVYGSGSALRELGTVGRQLKSELKSRTGASVRFVDGQRGVLSAAQVKFNQLTSKGIELLVCYDGKKAVVGITTEVQDIDWYSERDYGRPSRSASVGMLPPKLAQMLVNTTSAATVVDPFCGTGVVLQEALLLGRNVVGSDLSDAMVGATSENLDWLEKSRPEVAGKWRVAEADARSADIPAHSAIVSEGYLGTHLEHPPSPAQLAELKRELRELYLETLGNFARQQVSGDEVSICAPAWRIKSGWVDLGLIDDLAQLGYTLKRFTHARTPIRYARADQVVGRQLLLLRKI